MGVCLPSLNARLREDPRSRNFMLVSLSDIAQQENKTNLVKS